MNSLFLLPVRFTCGSIFVKITTKTADEKRFTQYTHDL